MEFVETETLKNNLETETLKNKLEYKLEAESMKDKMEAFKADYKTLEVQVINLLEEKKSMNNSLKEKESSIEVLEDKYR